jgi:hypothetical protein
MKKLWLALYGASALPSLAAAQDISSATQATMPPPSKVEFKADRSADVATPKATPDRITYVASALSRGTTVPIKQSDMTFLCGDKDGCTFRLAMYNYDGTGRAASISYLLFYNPATKTWRASNDAMGQDGNNVVEHVAQAWSCYFTDGEYAGYNGTDLVQGFGLLSWTQYNADCWLTIIN